MTRSDSRPQRLYILTGEPSGEARRPGRAHPQQWPEVEIRGMGGDAMKAQGVDLLEHVSNTAIMGFAEVVAKLGHPHPHGPGQGGHPRVPTRPHPDR